MNRIDSIRHDAEQAFERYAADKNWTPAEKAEARSAYLDSKLDGAALRAERSESYAVPSIADAADDKLYLDDDAWNAHMAGLHDRPKAPAPVRT